MPLFKCLFWVAIVAIGLGLIVYGLFESAFPDQGPVNTNPLFLFAFGILAIWTGVLRLLGR